MRTRKTMRFKKHEYTSTANYFITIKTQDNEMLFGRVRHNQVELNATGQIVQEEWTRLERRHAIVQLDQYVIMPNHFHGILRITEATSSETRESTNQLSAGSLGAIIGQFKSRTVKRLRRKLEVPDLLLWQRNYFERVIRDERALERFRRYIANNPLRWLE